MIEFPPVGYQFEVHGSARQKLLKTAAGWGMARSLLVASASTIPIALVKAWLQRWDKTSSATALTYAVDHLVFRPEPWVLVVEYAIDCPCSRPLKSIF